MPQHGAQTMSDNDDEQEDITADLKAFISAAKWTTHAISPFINLDSVIAAGLHGYCQADYERREDFDADMVLFDAIMALHEDFRELIEGFRTKPESLARFLRVLTHHMREAQSQDTNAMKFSIISYLPLNSDKDVIVPPITGNQKSKHGWNHIWTTRFLCPLRDCDIFEENPHAYMKRVQQGKIKLRAKNLPSFLYEDGTVYCATREDKGLFRGHIVIQALRLIFTGESSAFTGHRSAARQSQAEIHGMRAITPQALAYACCQVYVNLLALEQWSNMDSYFDVEKFYKLIVGLFREPCSRWAENTLDQLPSLKRKAKQKRAAPVDDSEADDSDGDPTGILAHQAARLDKDSDGEDTSKTQAPAQNPSIRHIEPPTPPESSPPLRQSAGTQARTQALQTTQTCPLPSQNVPRPLEPSNRVQIRPPRSHGETENIQPSKRPKTRPQLSQSSPVHPQNMQEPLAQLNGIQEHARVSQSSPACSRASQRSESPPLRPRTSGRIILPSRRTQRSLSVDDTDGEVEIEQEEPAPHPEDVPLPKTKRGYVRKGTAPSKKKK